jgi:hypothetical protein
MPVAFDDAGLEAPLEEVAAPRVAPVEAHCVDAVQPLHPARELGLGRLHKQVEVVVEQVPGVHLPSKTPLDFDEELEPRLPVEIVEHDRSLLDAATDDVVPGRTRQLAARYPRHASKLPRRQLPRNRREGTSSRDSPWDMSLADNSRADCA